MEGLLIRIKFYADTPVAANKLFVWDIEPERKADEFFNTFLSKGWNIRAAWIEKIDTDSGEVLSNERLDVEVYKNAFAGKNMAIIASNGLY